MSSDYASPLKDHPPCLSVREDRLLAHIDQWLSKLFTPENIEATAASIVTADSEGRREDPEVARARITLVESERKLAKHLDGLEAGIPAEVIAPRIAATQREKAAAEAVIASAPQPPNHSRSTKSSRRSRCCVTCRSCSAPSNKQIVPRCIKPWVSTSPTDVWEPLSRCA